MMRASGASFVGVLCFAFACGSGSTSGTGGGVDGGDDHPAAVCGDGVCASSELGNCPDDCGNAAGSDTGSDPGSGDPGSSCGDLVCDTSKGEDATTCPSDCTPTNGSGGSGGGSGTCSEDNLLACIDCEATEIDESAICPDTNPAMTLGDCDICIISSGL